jgi:hypothetical protein
VVGRAENGESIGSPLYVVIIVVMLILGILLLFSESSTSNESRVNSGVGAGHQPKVTF